MVFQILGSGQERVNAILGLTEKKIAITAKYTSDFFGSMTMIDMPSSTVGFGRLANSTSIALGSENRISALWSYPIGLKHLFSFNFFDVFLSPCLMGLFGLFVISCLPSLLVVSVFREKSFSVFLIPLALIGPLAFFLIRHWYFQSMIFKR